MNLHPFPDTVPVSTFSSSPNASSTLTTSFASMFSQAIDMTKAATPRRNCMDQCGGLLALMRKKSTTDSRIPARRGRERGREGGKEGGREGGREGMKGEREGEGEGEREEGRRAGLTTAHS